MSIQDILYRGMPAISVQTSQAQAIILLQGAHLISWIPIGGEEVFYVSPLGAFCEGVAVRGGVPLCWPWFGKAQLPAHGLARINCWKYLSSSEDKYGNAHIAFALDIPLALAQTAQLWCGETVECHFVIGRSLEQRLITTAGSVPLTLSEAFHNYFSVGNISDVLVSGLNQSSYEELSPAFIEENGDYFHICGHIDRIYSNSRGEVVIDDIIKSRVIRLMRKESGSVVVWNPAKALSLEMKDLPDDAWKEFLCVETANIGKNARILAPFQRHQLYQEIKL